MPTNVHTLFRQQAPQRWPHIDTPTATGPITDTELDEINKLASWPTSYPTLTEGCTGNCSQGRMCDCVADVDFAEKPPMTRRDGWTVLVLAICCAAVWYVAIWGMV